VIERAAILGVGKRLEVARALGLPNRAGPTTLAARRDEPAKIPEEFLTLDRAMARHIEEALTRTSGKIEGIAGAAALLGINPHTLRSRMRKLGIDWRWYRQTRFDPAIQS
jgi:transcriptional regulator with GAF, ATPase, and Fis domain